MARRLGLEGIAWVPDACLVRNRFEDQNTHGPYDPAHYPSHGTGLFFVGLEANGQIYAYALNFPDSTYVRVATIDSGYTRIMYLSFDPDAGGQMGGLWAYCDNSCRNETHLLGIDTTAGSAGCFSGSADDVLHECPG